MGYAKGLPLALTILGSDLYDSDMQQWKSALESYKEIPNPDIQETLKISYNRLDDRAKKIFLDIACFFIGVDVDHVITILDNCHFYIKKLIDKCLISIEFKRLRMHDLLRDMGREVVRQESDEPGERSRLWFHEDIRHVLEDNTGTNKVEGIVIELPKPDLIHLSSKVFKKMTRLRLFINRNACFLKDLIFCLMS
ncbi:TMV resistance protein N [Morella rubra]|uniref:TMV resistance protein N n=1 Tax=Morella rubra TaxID=262757 RepID=A0A6A1UJ02_9ROSI|nr:TMV resistance protein N [Morella rubra]